MSISLLLGIPGKIKKLSDTLTRVENTVNNFSGGVISNADYVNVKTYADVRLALPKDTYTPLASMSSSDVNSKPRYTLGTGWVIGTPVSIYTANTKLAFGSLEIKGRQSKAYSSARSQKNNLTVKCEFTVKINDQILMKEIVTAFDQTVYTTASLPTILNWDIENVTLSSPILVNKIEILANLITITIDPRLAASFRTYLSTGATPDKAFALKLHAIPVT